MIPKTKHRRSDEFDLLFLLSGLNSNHTSLRQRLQIGTSPSPSRTSPQDKPNAEEGTAKRTKKLLCHKRHLNSSEQLSTACYLYRVATAAQRHSNWLLRIPGPQVWLAGCSPEQISFPQRPGVEIKTGLLLFLPDSPPRREAFIDRQDSRERYLLTARLIYGRHPKHRAMKDDESSEEQFSPPLRSLLLLNLPIYRFVACACNVLQAACLACVEGSRCISSRLHRTLPSPFLPSAFLHEAVIRAYVLSYKDIPQRAGPTGRLNSDCYGKQPHLGFKASLCQIESNGLKISNI